jgi:hypothetical protein
MPSLKALRARIASVRNTRKITSAMKMVAAAKLKRAQARMESARPFANRMAHILAILVDRVGADPQASPLLAGTGRDHVHLLVVITADRGLAGPFNTNAAKKGRSLAYGLEEQGKTVKILTVGRKGRDYLRRGFGDRIVEEISYDKVKQIGFAEVDDALSRRLSPLGPHKRGSCPFETRSWPFSPRNGFPKADALWRRPRRQRLRVGSRGEAPCQYHDLPSTWAVTAWLPDHLKQAAQRIAAGSSAQGIVPVTAARHGKIDGKDQHRCLHRLHPRQQIARKPPVARHIQLEPDRIRMNRRCDLLHRTE